ncbi:MAG: 30S ribosomal protein S8 [Candidatus Nomurabacteria bacterium]|jgi:small subunit ribosomal protein S8|nr:30S ribosomal protein S8 [Candidatus Nomurabacteria bacterium]
MSLQSTDPIADMLTRVRNAINVGKRVVSVPSSKLKLVVAKELKKCGYLTDVKVEKAAPRDNIVITINDEGQNPTITEIARVSKPGRRVYAGAADIPKIRSGRGVVLVSTSKGVMTGREAIRQHLGGELICKVY